MLLLSNHYHQRNIVLRTLLHLQHLAVELFTMIGSGKFQTTMKILNEFSGKFWGNQRNRVKCPRFDCYLSTVSECKMSVGDDSRSMSPLLDLAKKFNCFYLSGLNSGKYTPFYVKGYQVGLISKDVKNKLTEYPEVFRVTNNRIELNPAFRDYEERTNKLDKVLRELRKNEAFVALKGWRDECYDVKAEFHTTSLLKMDRSATCLFGIRNYGVDINGYVMHPEKGLCIWVQQRSSTKQTWPNMWDNMVAGGLSVGHNILDTAHKEAKEEASIPDELLNKLVSAGCVSFYFQSERGLFPNTEFVFDLELPLNFIPQNADGEVQKFELLTASECIERILAPKFKTTSAPVTLDFLMRHGFVTPDKEPYYNMIMELLHVPLQTIYNNQSAKENGQIL